jgi:hypothetical protein
MLVEVVRIALAIAIDVGAGWILRARPEVVCLRIEVVQSARAALGWEGRDGQRRLQDVRSGSVQNPVAICLGYQPKRVRLFWVT